MAPIARKRIPRTKKLSPMSYTNAEPAYSMDAALELDEGVQVYNRQSLIITFSRSSIMAILMGIGFISAFPGTLLHYIGTFLRVA